MLRIAILSLLSDGPSSGYDLSKAFGGSVTYVWAASQSQIYPELHRLEERGLIEGTDVPQRGRPDKREYRITEAGQAELLAWVDHPPKALSIRDPFQLKVLYIGRLAPDRAVELVAEQRALLRARADALESIRELLEAAGNTPGSPYSDTIGWRLSVEAGVTTVAAYIAWCDWAIEHIEASADAVGSDGT